MKLAASHTAEFARELSPDSQRRPKIEDLATQRLKNDCPYSFYFREISVDYADHTLILRGQVPSFYLKQVLQTLLTQIDGVSRIDNRVDVTSSTGLSSVRARDVPF